MIDWSELTWPQHQLGHALWSLARSLPVELPPAGPIASSEHLDEAALTRWVDQYAAHLGMKAERRRPRYGELEELLDSQSPWLFTVRSADAGWLAVSSVCGTCAVLLGPGGLTQEVDTGELVHRLRRPIDDNVQDPIARVLALVDMKPAKRARAERALLDERARDELLDVAWSLQPREPRSLRSELGARGIWRVVARTFVAHAVSYALALASFWVVGRAALLGHLDVPWLWAWALLMFLQLPLIIAEGRSHGQAGVLLGTWLRQKLVTGILALSPDRLRGLGVGAFVGQMMEVQVAESLALGTGFAGAVAVLEIIASAVVFALSPGGSGPLFTLALWAVLAVALCMQYVSLRKVWAEARLRMTHDLVESMSGHRTRLALEPAEHWHDGEDQALANYLGLSERADRSMVRLAALLPRGYLVVALLSLSPAFVDAGRHTESLAVVLGTVLLAFRAWRRVVSGVESVAALAIARQQLAPLLAGVRPPMRPSAPLSAPRLAPSPGEVVLEARDIAYAHRPRGRAVLTSCSLRIASGDRMLVEGHSGGGKSTLAAILSGIRDSTSGVLLSRGLDRFTLGDDEWHQRVVLAPQFHENHVFSNSFIYNIMLGASFPWSHEQLRAVREICHELALDDLLARMPAGLDQMVGETGWQLSHGEKSRLFIARALIQDPDVVLLDESLAALDPHTLQQVLWCLQKRARSLLLVAHP